MGAYAGCGNRDARALGRGTSGGAHHGRFACVISIQRLVQPGSADVHAGGDPGRIYVDGALETVNAVAHEKTVDVSLVYQRGGGHVHTLLFLLLTGMGRHRCNNVVGAQVGKAARGTPAKMGGAGGLNDTRVRSLD